MVCCRQRCFWDAGGSRDAGAQTQGTRLVSSTSSPRPSAPQLCQPKRAFPWVKQGRKGFCRCSPSPTATPTATFQGQNLRPPCSAHPSIACPRRERQHLDAGWGNATKKPGLMICALGIPHPLRAEAKQSDGIGKPGFLNWLLRRRWVSVPALKPAQPSSEILSQLFLFFIFLTGRPPSGQSTFIHRLHLLSHTEWGMT